LIVFCRKSGHGVVYLLTPRVCLIEQTLLLANRVLHSTKICRKIFLLNVKTFYINGTNIPSELSIDHV